jgi:hypothetical protein
VTHDTPTRPTYPPPPAAEHPDYLPPITPIAAARAVTRELVALRATLTYTNRLLVDVRAALIVGIILGLGTVAYYAFR